MTQENKQLLLKDLCARLPYGVKLYIKDAEKGESNVLTGVSFRSGLIETYSNEYYIEDCKPYLRPMSSMTVKEEYEYHQCKNFNYLDICEMEHEEILETTALCFSHAIDWLDKNKFDYRGLIPMGLALEAPEDMYKTE